MVKNVTILCLSLPLILTCIFTLPGPEAQAARLADTPVPEPVAVIRQPVNNTVIRGQVPIIGDALNPVSFDYYKVEYVPEGQEQDEWKLIGAQHQVQVAADTLEVWDTTLVPEGSYRIRLRVVDKSGNYREYLVRGLTVIHEQATATPTAIPQGQPTAGPALTLTPALPASAEGQLATPVLMSTPGITQTPSAQLPAVSSYDTTLAGLGYGEQVLRGYGGSTEYSFIVPDDWLLLEGGYLNLHISYTSAPKEMQKSESWMNAVLIVDIDDKTQVSTPLPSGVTEDSYMNVVLPPGLFADRREPDHTIKVTLDVDGECYWVMTFRLKIHPDSFLHFEYKRDPVPIDLALYPRPFVQNSLKPDAVRFVLPARLASHDLASALAISAKLGQLSHERAVISSTTDVKLLEHPAHIEPLIVVGKPHDNRLIASLASLVDLPVALGKREMLLATQGPKHVTPGQPFTYTITVTNTTARTAAGLAMLDILPRGTQFLACEPGCSQEGRNIFWKLEPLASGQASTATLTLQTVDNVTEAIIENSVILTGSNRALLNANTFATAVSSSQGQQENGVSLSSGEGFFFITPEGREVAESDGIIQEIHSPWNPGQAILVVTGLTDEALYKASQVLSTQTYFPGMQGSFALIQGILPPTGDQEEVLKEQVTFADMGFGDEVIDTLFGTHDIYYTFKLPAAWTIGGETYLQLHFSHSQLLSASTSWLGVSFNGKPLATVPLDNSNASRGILEVYLPPAEAQSGINGLTVSAALDWNGEECIDPRVGGIWLVIYKDSFLHLSYEKQRLDLTLNLSQFPYPFAASSDLNDLAFVLPRNPTVVEQEGSIRLAAQIGYESGGDHFAPQVVLGDEVSQEIKENCDIIAIGRPTANGFIREINGQLPQPFREGFDEIEQQIDRIVFRLPEGISLGLMEEVPSSWNENRAILAVTGTTDEGVAQALAVLTNPSLDKERLRGNLVIIREGQIHNIETRQLTSSGKAMAALTAVPELAPEGEGESGSPVAATTPVTATASVTAPVTQAPLTGQLTPTIALAPTGWKRPAWLTPLAAGSVLTALLLFAFGARQTAKKRE